MIQICRVVQFLKSSLKRKMIHAHTSKREKVVRGKAPFGTTDVYACVFVKPVVMLAPAGGIRHIERTTPQLVLVNLSLSSSSKLRVARNTERRR